RAVPGQGRFRRGGRYTSLTSPGTSGRRRPKTPGRRTPLTLNGGEKLASSRPRSHRRDVRPALHGRPARMPDLLLADRTPDAPLVTFSHAALVDHTFFAGQMPALVARYRVLTWDIRGHGASRPLQGPFTIPDVVADLIAII